MHRLEQLTKCFMTTRDFAWLGAARGEDGQRILHRRRHTSDAGERRCAMPDSRFESAVQRVVVTQRMADVCQAEMYVARLVVARAPRKLGGRLVRRVALDETQQVEKSSF